MSRPTIAPNRQLDQHFLVDENILGVIGRLSSLDPDDVVLEVGAGLGVLTRYLAERVGLVHAIEIDRMLEPALRERLAGLANVRLLFADALRVALDELDPKPTKLVSNLPYSIATPLIVETLEGLPSVELWCIMVQREVADRLVARPGTKAYGAVSVLVQRTASRAGFHRVARTCFYPPPNVDSALVALRRTRRFGPEFAHLRHIVQSAFAHRRKTLPNALELAGVAPRARTAAVLRELGHPENARAESLAPDELAALAEALR